MSELTDVIQHPQEAVAKIVNLEAKIARLVEVGDAMHLHWISCMDGVFYCTFCNQDVSKTLDHECEHLPDCPVTLWNKEAHE